MSSAVHLEITIPSDTSAGHEVQERIVSLMEEREYSMRDVFSVRLALEEALVNAIKHGNQLDPDKSVRIQCDVEQDRVYVEIEDQGPGYVPDDVPDPTLDENIERASGRGLMLIKSFMNRVEFNEKGNCIRLEKLRSTEEEAG
ncbi:Anti-sigma F factor [Caulifigura coniformis]|uniref:Anti-sigma F factor n=1 Tax=Caulifigura coniformis TaxID=2527983 RepID=A0A517SM42_9PLAN|nr:ATP-binding protein [Caulifigura coniformis]QDT57199.1 Anti-sigma F factor [Caulifigura coniformis]